MRYTPDDYNDYHVLKIPLGLGLLLVYLNKYILLFLLGWLPTMRGALDFLQQTSATRLDPGLLLISLPAVAVAITGFVRRVPKGGSLPRLIWRHAGMILLLVIVGETVLIGFDVWRGHKELTGLLVSFGYLNLLGVFYLLRSRRAADTIAEFPDPPSESGL